VGAESPFAVCDLGMFADRAEMRGAAGLTQAGLADALGVSQARVSKIEHGEISGIEIACHAPG
jgi:transcriptional regulator with XRE-family HTH domain